MEKKCKYCAMMIPKDAKICPHCRKTLGMTMPVKVVIGLFLFGALMSAIAGNQSTPPTSNGSNSVQKEKDMEDYAVRYASIEFLKKQLKAPSTASIPDLYELQVTQKPEKKNTWIVTGTVDAQNSYGAKLRQNFRFTIRKDKDGGMSLVKSNFQ